MCDTSIKKKKKILRRNCETSQYNLAKLSQPTFSYQQKIYSSLVFAPTRYLLSTRSYPSLLHTLSCSSRILCIFYRLPLILRSYTLSPTNSLLSLVPTHFILCIPSYPSLILILSLSNHAILLTLWFLISLIHSLLHLPCYFALPTLSYAISSTFLSTRCFHLFFPTIG